MGWKMEEEQFLKDNHSSMSLEAMSVSLDKPQTVVRSRMGMLGLGTQGALQRMAELEMVDFKDKRELWTEEEKDYLKTNHLKYSIFDLSLHLKRRVLSIIAMADTLGIPRYNVGLTPWSYSDLEYLKNNYRSESRMGLVINLNKRWEHIMDKAVELGLSKKTVLRGDILDE